MGGHREDPAVAVVEVRLEHLDSLVGDESTTHAAKKFLGLTAEHHAGYDLDPTFLGAVIHGSTTVVRRGEVGGSIRLPILQQKTTSGFGGVLSGTPARATKY